MKANLLFALGSSLLLWLSSSLPSLASAQPSSGVPSANARVTEYSDAGCTQAYATYYSLPRGVCVGDDRTGGSMRVTCGSGAAPTFERFAANTACGGTPVMSAVGTVATPYAPLVATSCIAASAPVNTTSSVIIQCAEAEVAWTSRTWFADSSCRVRQDVTRPSYQESETAFSTCENSFPRSFTSYASFVDSGRAYDYTYSKPNCSTADVTSVATVELNVCLETLNDRSESLAALAAGPIEWSMVTAPSDATLRGPAPPTSWPPAADNSLVFSYQCGDQACSRGCRVASATKLGGCQPVTVGSTSNPVVAWQKKLCTADTKNAATATYFDATCSASKLTGVSLTPANNQCSYGRYTNCGNGNGVVTEARVPATLPSLVQAMFKGGICTGNWTLLSYSVTDMCFPDFFGQGGTGPLYAAKWSIVNTTAYRMSYTPTADSTVAAPDCNATAFHTDSYTLGACSSNYEYITAAQLAAQAGISIDTTTVSNGISGLPAGGGNGGNGNSASTLAVSGIASCFFAALVAMIAQLTQ